MNKKLLPLIVGVLLILGLGTFGVSKLLNKNKTSEDTIVKTSPVEEEQNSVSGSIFDLIKLGKTVKCSYSIDSEDTKMNGVSYVSGKKVRGDFSVTGAEDVVMESHMISDGEWVYTWSSNTPQGFKMKITEAEAQSEGTSNENTAAASLKDTFDYKCVNWVLDTSVFTVPTDVTFVDFSEMMEKFNMENTQPGGGNACSACDYLPSAEDKATCREQLGC